MQARIQKERNALKRIERLEDLAEKKTKIFSRLLMDAALAQDMESLSMRHAERKQAIAALLGKKQKDGDKEETQS